MAFADAGADVLFIDALASREEMKSFCDVYPLLPKMVILSWIYWFESFIHPLMVAKFYCRLTCSKVGGRLLY